jgi:hypothetical protein
MSNNLGVFAVNQELRLAQLIGLVSCHVEENSFLNLSSLIEVGLIFAAPDFQMLANEKRLHLVSML